MDVTELVALDCDWLRKQVSEATADQCLTHPASSAVEGSRQMSIK